MHNLQDKKTPLRSKKVFQYNFAIKPVFFFVELNSQKYLKITQKDRDLNNDLRLNDVT